MTCFSTGLPLWNDNRFLAVVGSREISPLTESWMKNHLPPFLRESGVGLVSGGARGVDQLAHQIALKCEAPTIVVLPSGLKNLYPRNLEDMRPHLGDGKLCLFSEFEIDQELRKSHFFFRNRIDNKFRTTISHPCIICSKMMNNHIAHFCF